MNRAKQDAIDTEYQRWQEELTKATEAHDKAYYGTEDEAVRTDYVSVHLRTHARLKAKHEENLAQIELDYPDPVEEN